MVVLQSGARLLQDKGVLQSGRPVPRPPVLGVCELLEVLVMPEKKASLALVPLLGKLLLPVTSLFLFCASPRLGSKWAAADYASPTTTTTFRNICGTVGHF